LNDNPYSKEFLPGKAPIALAILNPACIKAAAIISLFGAAFIIIILIGAAIDIDKAPHINVMKAIF
jgi:hypothetical protein